MGYYCTVPQCTSLAGKTKNVKFHRFPRDLPMAEKWNLILKRGKPITKYSKVCSLHFTQADYNITTMGQWKTLSKDAVPSQNLPKLNPDGSVMVIRKSRTVKYRDGKKDEIKCEKSDKWMVPATNTQIPTTPETTNAMDLQDSSLAYRLQLPTTINSLPTPHIPHQISQIKPKKQDAIMQTDPINSEEDDTQPNNSYSEASEKSYSSELDPYSVGYKDENYEQKKYEIPKDYTKNNEDYIPQTNEEYNKEAERYALERKAIGYEKDVGFKPEGYQKIDVFNGFQRNEYAYNGYSGSADVLRNQQHNLQILQEQHRINENQNFFNENHIKQEIDINNDDDKFSYERSKETVESNPMYENQRRAQQNILEHIQHQVKREPEPTNGCETVMQPQGSPYYAANGHNNVPGGYYEALSRPGPELLIAKQNALAAHTQLWQNTRKIPFFYSEGVPYSGTQILHRYEDIPRILQ